MADALIEFRKETDNIFEVHRMSGTNMHQDSIEESVAGSSPALATI